MANIKISQLTAKSANLASSDLIEISESDGQGGYVTKSVTGANVLSSKQDTLVSATNIKTINSTTLLGAGDLPVQTTLVSGTNIKTVNSATLLGSGDIPVQATLVSGTNIKTINSTTILGSGNLPVQDTLVSGTNIKTIENQSLLGAGNIDLGKSDVGLGNVDNTSDINKPISTATQNALNNKQNTITNSDSITEGATNLFLTSAERTKLVNTSGINTGDQTNISGTANNVTGIVALANGGTGTATPSLVAGTNVTITGTFPNQTIAATGGGSPSGVAGAIQFSNGSAFSSDATNLFFDDVNNRLGVGQNVPTARVHIKGAGATNATTSLLVHNSSDVASLQCTDDLSVFSHGKGATASNTVFGKGAFQGTATGAQSTIFGVDAGKVISGGNGNNLFGYQAGLSLGNGGNNVLVGNNAGVNIGIGSFNTFIGNSAGGGVISGSNNTFIGYNLTGTSAMAGTIMIGSGDTATGSNQCRFGSVGTNAGAVTAEVVAQANTWSVFINGVARKILLA